MKSRDLNERKIEAHTLAKMVFSRIKVEGGFEFFHFDDPDYDNFFFDCTLSGYQEYNFVFTSNYKSGRIFCALSNAHKTEIAKLLSDIEQRGRENKQLTHLDTYSTSRQYFCKKGYSGVVLLEPEDMQILGTLSHKESIDTYQFSIYFVLLLSDQDMKMKTLIGDQFLVKIFENDARDFFSI